MISPKMFCLRRDFNPRVAVPPVRSQYDDDLEIVEMLFVHEFAASENVVTYCRSGLRLF